MIFQIYVEAPATIGMLQKLLESPVDSLHYRSREIMTQYGEISNFGLEYHHLLLVIILLELYCQLCAQSITRQQTAFTSLSRARSKQRVFLRGLDAQFPDGHT
ncbi:hypothetical protein PspR76_14950 [Pseudomonas sp. R76]|nr:hypothetical protein PspR76_14950 [Pseudomonas sp. R76]